jgi:prolyl oligopeptidase
MKTHPSLMRQTLASIAAQLPIAGAVLLLAACTSSMNGSVAGADSARPAAPAPTESSAAPATAIAYPSANRDDVVDVYHGSTVADPYRWLEKVDSPATQAWVKSQNELAQPRLEAIPHREWVKRRLTQLWNYERFGVPVKKGSRYFFLRNDGTQNQSVLHVSESLDSNGKVLFDPNGASSDATIALSEFTPGPKGDLVAYALSDGGTDWQIWKFRRASDQTDVADELRHTKFWGVSWAHDGSGVYYSRYPALPNGKGDDAGRPDLYFHKLGEPQAKDRLVYKVPDHPTRVPSARVTDDGRYLIITLYEGDIANGVDILDLRRANANAKARRVFGKWDALYAFLGSRGDDLYFQTTNDAPLGRIIAVDANRPEPAQWRTVVPESDLALEDSSYIAGRLIASYVKDAHSLVRLYERDGRLVGEVKLPGLGHVDGFTGDSEDRETFFTYTDYLAPGSVFRFDPVANTSTPWRVPRLPASTDAFMTEQVFYQSKDGTRVPMFITRRRDMQKNGNQPVLLYGYGGFNVSITPLFRPATLAWLEMGGVYAEANLRGGGEYGEKWHQAGTRSQKQNVFDDFIAAAEYLIQEKYTQPSKLAIYGRSNGGLLVGAALTQRPDLFGAALPAVGVLDMLRYHTASANARQWASDYGLSEDADDFKAQFAYSPVHNVKPGTCYPPTLVTTADHDDRVVPWHSFKFAAALQNAQACENPVLIRVETRAGHGAGKPVWMQIEDFADQWAFLAKSLQMPVPAT